MNPGMPMDVLHTVASTHPGHGGPSRSVPFLCEALGKQDTSVRLVTTVPRLNKTGGEKAILPGGPVEVCAIEEGGAVSRMLRAPVGFYHTLREQMKASPPDVLHDHGAWLPSNVLAAIIARKSGVPLVISTRGMFTASALQQNRWKKKAAWHAYQKHVLRQAALFHVTSQKEVDALRRMGCQQPAALIPNGVRVPSENGDETVHGEKRRALFLSRLHPIKGLPMLLDAWARICPQNWVLELVGPSEENHRSELEEQVRRHELEDSVRFSGAVSEEEKWDVYRQADLFVLPSHSENFGIVVAEALGAGLPVITTTGTPWKELEEYNCGWWVNPEADLLSEALREAVQQSSKTLQEMGQRGRKLVEERYTWSGVAAQLQASYRWIVGEAARPDCIQM